MLNKTGPTRTGSGGKRATPRPDGHVPYTMKLADGRVVYIELPRRWVTRERGGEMALSPQAVAFLDKLRALSARLTDAPSPGFLASLRAGLGMTQKSMGQAIGVDRLTVSRWERGELRPSSASLTALERLRQKAVRRGVTLAA
jgi:DNA-binding transcriptional regulator YiaG